jgi:hypothetical protein
MKRIALLAIGAVLALAGCSSGDKGSNGGAVGGGKAPNCPDAAKVGSALDMSLKAPSVTGNDVVRVCTYAPQDGTGTALVRLQAGSSATTFAQGKEIFKNSGQTATDETGVGDEAYSSTLSGGSITVYTIVARKGTLEVLVTSPAPLDKAKSLANDILG